MTFVVVMCVWGGGGEEGECGTDLVTVTSVELLHPIVAGTPSPLIVNTLLVNSDLFWS